MSEKGCEMLASNTAAAGKAKKERYVKPQDCTKCRYKCSVHINEEERKEIFNSYWQLDSLI